MVSKVHIFISGRVQKVGFRFFTCQRAQSLGLSGWVKNLADGRVELEVAGNPEKINQLVSWLNQGSPLSRVDDVWIADRILVEKYPFSGFKVKATN